MQVFLRTNTSLFETCRRHYNWIKLLMKKSARFVGSLYIYHNARFKKLKGCHTASILATFWRIIYSYFMTNTIFILLQVFLSSNHFGDIWTCIYCVLYCLYCVFVLFRLCIFILTCFVCASVRVTATESQLNCSN